MADATRVLVRTLRAGLRSHHLRSWKELRVQGRAAESLSQHPASTSYLLSGRLGLADWRFLHRARTSSLPLNAATARIPSASARTPRSGEDTRCRRCGQAAESLAHILQHCRLLSAPRIQRHHSVVQTLSLIHI